jgi:hypothetical protein
MNQNQRNKLAEAMRLIREVMSENGSEQLPLIQPPAVADLTGISSVMKDFTKAIYRTFGMNSVKPSDQRVRGIQAETGMMRIDNFVATMTSRNIIEVTHEKYGHKTRVGSFRFVKTIPQ